MLLANNCVIVKGAYKSSFVDLQRQKLITILTEEINHYFDKDNNFDLELLKANNLDFINS